MFFSSALTVRKQKTISKKVDKAIESKIDFVTFKKFLNIENAPYYNCDFCSVNIPENIFGSCLLEESQETVKAVK